MKHFVLGLFLTALLVSNHVPIAEAQETPAGGAEMDATAFRLDSAKAMVEIDYGILYQTLSFSPDKGGWTAPINARAEAWQSGKLVASQEVQQQVHFTGTKHEFESAGATKVVGVANLPIGYGVPVHVVLLWRYKRKDGSIGTDSTLVRDVPVPELFTDRLSLSSIELASNLEKATTDGNPLEKVGYIVTPNPSSVFGEMYNKLFYYAELYLPASLVKAGTTAQITAVIQDGAGHTLVNTTRNQELIAQSIPVLGSLDVDGLPGDSYKLIISASRNGNEEARAAKTFYYESSIKLSEESAAAAAPTTPTDDQGIYLNADISKMSDNELNERFEQARYIASADDKKAWKTITDSEAKRKFFFNFWRKFDKPTDKPLDFYRIYAQRTEEANKRFTHQKTVGWKSDMGRIYMTYGPCDREFSKPFTTDALPSVVWEYTNMNMIVNSNLGEETGELKYTPSLPHFIFIDRQGAGKYVLIHSNVKGETSEPDWYTRDAKKTF